MEDKIRKSLYIARLLVEYVDNPAKEISPELQQWIDSSKENKKMFEEMSNGKILLEESKWYHSIDVDKEWEQFKKNKLSTKKRSMLYWRKWVGAVAAALLLPILSIYLINKFTTQSTEYVVITGESIQPGKMVAMLQVGDREIILDETMALSTEKGMAVLDSLGTPVYSGERQELPRINTLIVPKGGEYFLTLGDGTKIWLNADSKLYFPECFEKEKRIVTIEGEAYLEVAKNNNSPFYVNLGEAVVHVTGTCFNVRRYTDESNTEVTLVEGNVLMEAENSQVLASLTPSMQFSIDKETKQCTVQEVDVDEVLAWKDGLFLFHENTLLEISNSLRRWYNIDFEVDASLMNVRYSGELGRYENIEPLFRILRSTKEIEIIQTQENKVKIIPLEED